MPGRYWKHDAYCADGRVRVARLNTSPVVCPLCREVIARGEWCTGGLLACKVRNAGGVRVCRRCRPFRLDSEPE